jgi:Bacterial Ig-like domain (group 2)
MNRNIIAVFCVCLGAVPALAQAPSIGACSVLPADNIWNTAIDQLPVSASSSTWVSTIGATSPLHPDFGAGIWNGAPIGIPFVTVPGTQTKYPATFTYASESDPGPYAVPLTAPIEGGSAGTGDRHAIAIDTNNCILYELFAATPQTSSWSAGSGAIYNLSSDVLRPAGWTSADAAGLPIFPGLLRYDEIAAGEIRHAIRFTVPQTQRAYVWPARHVASTLTGTQYPPMGARFRLKASFDISGFSPANQIILRALKKYGMMLADNGSAWYVSGAPDSRWDDNDLHNLTQLTGNNFEAVDASPLMVNVDSGQAVQSGVSVSVTPGSASVNLNASQQFTVTVKNSTDQTVLWSVNGVPGGNSTAGSIGASGLYTAPATLPSPAAVTVEAASNSTPSAFGIATVTVIAPQPPAVTVSISPTRATVQLGRQLRFSAKVQGSTNQTVTWEVNGIVGGNRTVGTIGSTGLYTAPNSTGSVVVTVVSNASPATSASAAVSVVRRH